MPSRPQRPRLSSLGATALLAAALTLALSGCGRKGDLDPPSTPAAAVNQKGNDTNKTVPERRFFLDPLL
ncbi:LPS translocon maturation chaperone LptM [Rhizobium sp. CC-YZS058]|uniref:LPS translocon maturation chaperone LptM n=1 Tax=Rhizobium sp. CC-YZS058 TaxID=3042153 RepID=UPI002B056CAF|nr:lipoprotein [Rhizobium sp. CC-YZS058]MEA3533806.1 lipoprotein [Rhizobium sp. CC-YZS058]